MRRYIFFKPSSFVFASGLLIPCRNLVPDKMLVSQLINQNILCQSNSRILPLKISLKLTSGSWFFACTYTLKEETDALMCGGYVLAC